MLTVVECQMLNTFLYKRNNTRLLEDLGIEYNTANKTFYYKRHGIHRDEIKKGSVKRSMTIKRAVIKYFWDDDIKIKIQREVLDLI